jgi:glycosyltransferase involved in cell wall biosynthesis
VRLVAVSRVLNEEDVIEAMVRHHAALVDHHVILDNGSVDRTIEILAALRAEGVSVSVFQNLSVMFAEEQFNTQLYDVAVGAHAADWVLFLDADEFVDARRVVDLRALLAAVPPQFASLGVQMINYDGPTEATLHEINVAQKFVRLEGVRAGVGGRAAHHDQCRQSQRERRWGFRGSAAAGCFSAGAFPQSRAVSLGGQGGDGVAESACGG